MQGDVGNTQDLVAIEDIKEGTVILKGGGLRQVIIVSGVNFSLKSEAEQNIITAGYQNFLNSLNFSLQILVHSRKINVERYLSNLNDRKNKEISPLLQDQIAEYQEFIRSFVAENSIMAKTFLVVVPYASVDLPTKEGFLSALPFFGGKKPDPKKIDEERAATFGKSLDQLKQRVNQVVEGLRSIGLDAMTLNNEQLTELFYNFYNPEAIEKEKAQETPAK